MFRGQSKGDPGESDAAGAAQGAPKIINHVRRLLGRSRRQPSNRSTENAGLAQVCLAPAFMSSLMKPIQSENCNLASVITQKLNLTRQFSPREISQGHVKLFVENDVVAALASGTMSKLNGCVLIAGTGQ